MEGLDTRVLDAHQVRVIAAVSRCDPRSVTKVLHGQPMRSSVAERVLEAVATLERDGRLPAWNRGPR